MRVASRAQECRIGAPHSQALVVRQHDDDLRVVIPNHPPEVLGGVWQRVLGYNKLIAPVIAL